jgi:hypothetical protein
VTWESVGHRGVFVADELCGVREVSIGAFFNFQFESCYNWGVAALVVRVSDEYEFGEADEVGFVGEWFEQGTKTFFGEDTGAGCEGARGWAFVNINRRVGMSVHGGGWQSRGW